VPSSFISATVNTQNERAGRQHVSGRFITFEGIDGAGKSTHIGPLAQRLRDAGATVVCTREPGGTPLAERIREIVLHTKMDALTETLLVFAARRDHIHEVIAPALALGHTVISDRFTDATFAYQGGGGAVPLSVLDHLENDVQGGLRPDLTIIFDLPAEQAAMRRARARAADRFEQHDLDYFERVRAVYAARMQGAPGRYVRVDAALEREVVWQQIDSALRVRGW
jgi:dTMP kinase